MLANNSKLRCTHLVPWDVGFDLNLNLRKKIIWELKKLGWRQWSASKYCRKGKSVHYIFLDKRLLTLDVFDDGYSIFSIHSRALHLDHLSIFDPLVVHNDKSKAHRALLGGTHICSSIIKQTMESLWKIVPQRHRRFSANSTWENNGLSYVFSFYLLRATSCGLRTKDLNLKFHALLFPAHTSDIDAAPEIDQAYSLEDHAFYEKDQTSLCTIIKTPHQQIFFSWATSIFAGASSSGSLLAYCRTMRELQHGWFFAYAVDQRLNEIVEDLPSTDSVDKLIGLDSQMSRAVREVTKFTSISNSMSTNLQLRILRVGVVQSGLVDLASATQTKLQFIRNEIASRIDRKNLRSYRTMEATLSVLAFVQTVSAYKSFEASGGLTPYEAMITGGLFIVLLLVLLSRR